MMFHFEKFTERTACITSSGEQISYGKLEELATRIGRLVDSHQLVFFLCSNTIGSIAGYVAMINNHNAILLLDAGMGQESYKSLLVTYHPKYIWAPSGCRLIHGNEQIFEAENYVLSRTRFKGPEVAENLAVLLTTSGSTGSPKLVRLSEDNLRSNALAIIDYLHITDKERPILGLPMNYAYGLSIVNSHLLSGATLLLTENAMAEKEFWQFAIDNGFTSYSGVPYAFEIIRNLKIWRQKMPSLHTVTQAGGALSREQVLFYNDLLSSCGVKFYVMYGQAEATARISYLEPEYIKTKAESIGKAIPGGKLWLVDEGGSIISGSGPDAIGELVYAGPNVCLGYAEKAADLKKGDENAGIIHTGDLAYQDDQGFYYIVGRNSRFIKLFGLRISLDHLESLLQPFLAEFACIDNDERVIVFTTDADYDENAIVDMLASRTKFPRKVFRIRHIDQMPRNTNGKIQYGQLGEMDSKCNSM